MIQSPDEEVTTSRSQKAKGRATGQPIAKNHHVTVWSSPRYSVRISTLQCDNTKGLVDAKIQSLQPRNED